MIIRVEVQPDRRRLAAALRHAHRRTLNLYRVGGLVAALPALLMLLDRDLYWATCWSLVAALIWMLPAWTVRSLVETSWKTYGIPVVWTIDDEGVRSSSALCDGIVRWAALEDVLPMRDQMIFRINRQQVFPVPVVDLSAAEREELLAFLRARNLLAGSREATPSKR